MSAIDTGKTKNSLFGNLKKAAQENQPKDTTHVPTVHGEDPQHIPEQLESTTQNQEPIVDQTTPTTTPKWQRLDKVTVLLSEEQKSGLDAVAKKLMRHRANALKGIEEKERITTNTLIRALIDNFLENEPELKVLTSEEDVCAWVETVFRDNSRS